MFALAASLLVGCATKTPSGKSERRADAFHPKSSQDLPPRELQARAERIARWDAGVRLFIDGQRPVLRACYDEELRRVENEAVSGRYANGEPVPGLAGELLLILPIEPDGRVRTPRIEDDTLGNPNVARCLLDEAARWNVSPAPFDEIVELEVPLSFHLEGT